MIDERQYGDITDGDASPSAMFGGEQLRLLKTPDPDRSGITAFGCIWTAMCAVIFPLFFASGDPPTVLYVFAVIFPTIGVLMLAPGIIGLLSRPRFDVSVPKIRVRGAVKPGEQLMVDVRQKNRAGDSLRDVTVSVELCQRQRILQDAGGSGVAARTAVSFGELFASDWQRHWSDRHTELVGFVAAGENLNIEHSFGISADLRGKPNQQEWWGIDVVTETDGRELFAGTFWLEPPQLASNSMALPGGIVGGFWGFGALGVLASLLTESLGGHPVLFGVVAIAAFGGLFGGAIAGALVATRAASLSPFRPLARILSKTHGAFQFFGSFVFAIASFFFAFYLADDMFNLFGWQDEPSKGQELDEHRPPGTGPSPATPRPEVSPVTFLDAVQRGDIPAMKRLAQRNPYVIHGVLTPAGGTALHQACVHNQVESAHWLIEQGAKIDARNANQATPLHICAWHGHVESARLLVENGADRAAEDRSGTTPEQRARQRGHEAVADYLKAQ